MFMPLMIESVYGLKNKKCFVIISNDSAMGLSSRSET